MGFKIIREPIGQVFRLTLLEKVSIISPNYLFTFVNEYSGESFSVILQDQSLCPVRYNQFTINGYLFSLPGWYGYEVREQESEINIDPRLSGAVVESGRLYVSNPDPLIFIQHENNSNNSTVYE